MKSLRQKFCKSLLIALFAEFIRRLSAFLIGTELYDRTIL